MPTPPFWLAIDRMVGCKKVTSKALVIKQNTANEDDVSRLRKVIIGLKLKKSEGDDVGKWSLIKLCSADILKKNRQEG